MADDDGDKRLEVLKEIRELQRQTLAAQSRFLWILLPIFALLTIQTILGLSGFFGS